MLRSCAHHNNAAIWSQTGQTPSAFLWAKPTVRGYFVEETSHKTYLGFQVIKEKVGETERAYGGLEVLVSDKMNLD